MCTAICDGYMFGRTLDVERSYGEELVIVPRRFLFPQKAGVGADHYAIMGIAHVRGVPFFFDAINEHGLSAAALNFPKSAVYREKSAKKHNIPSYDLITYVLATCKSLQEARALLSRVNITDESLFEGQSPSPLHWIFSFGGNSLAVEPVTDGLAVYDDPYGVLTNEPPFPYQVANLSSYAHLSPKNPENTLCPDCELPRFSHGMGGFSMPGDFSPPSRFVRAVFAKFHTTKESDATLEKNRFFHILDTVSIPKGCVKTSDGKDVLTLYSCCADTRSLVYSVRRYSDPSARDYKMTDADILGDSLICRRI